MKKLCLLFLSLLMLLFMTACSSRREADTSESELMKPMPEVSDKSNMQEQEDDMQQTTKNQQESSFEEPSGRKNLIAYFSLIDIVPEGADASAHATPSIGNTESAAMEIQKQVGGDLFAIQTVQTYPVSHRECSSIAEEEMRSDARPELSTHVENMEKYDTVFIGFPIWWYMEPMAIRTFLEEYDLAGKTIIPFCTTMGAGVGESVENITSFVPEATVLEGLTLHTGQEDFSEEISVWLADIGMTE